MEKYHLIGARNALPLIFTPNTWGYVRRGLEGWGCGYEEMLTQYGGGSAKVWVAEREQKRLEALVLARLKEEGFAQQVAQSVDAAVQAIERQGEANAAKGDFTTLSLVELVRMVVETLMIQSDVFVYGGASFLDSYAGQYVRERLPSDEDFALLVTPLEASFLQEQESDLYEIARKSYDQADSTDALLAEHAAKYGWYFGNYESAARTPEAFGEALWALIAGKSKEDIEREIVARHQVKQDLERRQNELIAQLDLDPELVRIIRGLRVLSISKDVRKRESVRALYLLRPIIQAIADKVELSVDQVKLLLPTELELLVTDLSHAKALVSARVVSFTVRTSQTEERVLTSEEVATWAEVLVEHSTGEIKGMTASPGAYRGRARVVINQADLQHFVPGEVFVGHSTSPDIILALRGAGAIITNEGGVASHAAIVSREMHIPCIVGARGATSIIKTGDLLEVDATKGVAHILPHE